MPDRDTLDLNGCGGRIMACRRTVDASHGDFTHRWMGVALDPAEHQAHGPAGGTSHSHHQSHHADDLHVGGSLGNGSLVADQQVGCTQQVTI